MQRSYKYVIILVAATGVAVGALVSGLLYYSADLFFESDIGKAGLAELEEELDMPLKPRGPEVDMELVLRVNVEQAVQKELWSYARSIEESFSGNNIDYINVEPVHEREVVRISYPDHDSMASGNSYINKTFSNLRIIEGKDTLAPLYGIKEGKEEEIKRTALEHVRKTISRRLEMFGIDESEITVRKPDRIWLRFSTVEAPERIKDNLTRSGKLDFMLVEARGVSKESVEDDITVGPDFKLVTWQDPALPGNSLQCYIDSREIEDSRLGEDEALPFNYRLVLQESDGSAAGNEETCFLLREDMTLSDSYIEDAEKASSGPMDIAVVNFRLNDKGAKKFARLTGENIGKRLAIVLEGKLISAPVIHSRISRRGQIQGNFSPQEARDLANVLLAGPLEVDIEIEKDS